MRWTVVPPCCSEGNPSLQPQPLRWPYQTRWLYKSIKPCKS